MPPGLYELLDALIPEFQLQIDVRLLVAVVAIGVGTYGLIFRGWK